MSRKASRVIANRSSSASHVSRPSLENWEVTASANGVYACLRSAFKRVRASSLRRLRSTSYVTKPPTATPRGEIPVSSAFVSISLLL
jgi:hypothetical protein